MAILILFFDALLFLVVCMTQLEANLHHLALSADWLKHVDSVVSMGSASHVVTSLRAYSKNVINRKRPKCSDIEPTPTSNAASGLGMFWWRGGRLSRQVFSWKVLPRSLTSKAARQGLLILFYCLCIILHGGDFLQLNQLNYYSEFV